MDELKLWHVLGFDLRMKPVHCLRSLSAEIREQRFSESEPRMLVSADPLVLSRDERVTKVIEGYSNTRDIVRWNPLGLASDPVALLDDCRAAGVATDEFLPLALTCSGTIIIPLETRFGGDWLDSLPSDARLIDDGWHRLGFDVVDLSGLVSGLSGCGYSDYSKTAYRRFFGDLLNGYGLFDSYSVAQRFAEARGLEIRDHAPFVVVGLLSPQEDIEKSLMPRVALR